MNDKDEVSQEHSEKLKELKKRVTDTGDLKEVQLLGYTRGYQTLDDSQKFLSQCVKWRAEFKPGEIKLKEISKELEACKAYFHTSCRDKQGRPVLIVKPARHDTNAIEYDVAFRHVVFIMEKCAEILEGSGKTQYVILYDRSGSSLKNIDLEFVKKVTSLQDYYPELLKRVFILYPNAIYKMMFKLAKPFLTAETLKKFVIVKKKETR